MKILLERGSVGRTWVVEEGTLRLAQARETAEARLDCAWDPAVVLRPGDVNAHTHLYSGLAGLGMPRPSARPRDLLGILREVWWRLDRALDERSLRAAARFAVMEAALAGTTTVIDHHESPSFIEGSLDVLADAVEEIGLRAALCYGVTERNQGPLEARRGLAECARFHATRRRGICGLIGVHASFTVGDGTLHEAGALARTLNTRVHVHVAEDRVDVEDARRRGRPGPFERLLALGALPPGSIMAHGVFLDRAQVRNSGEDGLWLVHNPRSNEGNGVGWASALDSSGSVALGTDGWPADMEAEEAALLRIGGTQGADPHPLRLRRTMGRRLAADVFGVALPDVLKDGAAADVVARIPGQRPRHVLVGGHLIVKDGRLMTADEEEIRAEAKEEAARLWGRMVKIPREAV